MSSYTASEARENFSDIISLVAYGKERQTVSRRGKEIVALVPIEDLRRLEELEDQEDLKDARAVLRSMKGKRGKPLAQLKEEMGL